MMLVPLLLQLQAQLFLKIGHVNEDSTVTKTGAQDDVLSDDAADTSGLSVTHIKPTVDQIQL